MLVPSCFYGLIKDVKRECAKIARKLLAGKSLEEAVAAYGMLDTRDFPDAYYYISVTHQHCAYPNAFHFPYLLWSADRIIMDRHGDDFSERDACQQRIFEELLKENWSVLCLSGDGASYFENMALFHDESTFDNRIRWIPYLKAVEKYWNDYAPFRNVEVIKGIAGRDTIWQSLRGLHFILANMGMPHAVLRRPLPGMNLKKLLDDYGVFDVDISQLPWRSGGDVPLLKKKMGAFEDEITELLADMVDTCNEYSQELADKIYIYAANEEVFFAHHFYCINNRIYNCIELNEAGLSDMFTFDVSEDYQERVLNILIEDIQKIEILCVRHNKPVPTLMKITYEPKTKKFSADYKYENQTSDDVSEFDNYCAWFEEEKAKLNGAQGGI